jgi:hypothetical protein
MATFPNGIQSGVPTLTDDQHMEPARVARLIESCHRWRMHAIHSGAPLVALPVDIGVAALDLVIAELATRQSGITLATAGTAEARESAMDHLRAASESVRESVDRLLDIDAQHALVATMQQRQAVFAAPARARRSEVRHA